jgi:hypothetical protein
MNFTISYDIPETVAKTLKENWSQIYPIHLKDIAIIGYKSGILTSYQVQLMLNHESRWETEKFLHKYQCHLLYDAEDFDEDGQILEEFFK